MSHFIQQTGDATLAVTFSGIMNRADRTAFESAARALIAKAGKINALIILKDFEGVGRDVDVNDMEFYAGHADDFTRMAVVGDPKWQTQAMLFTGAGARKTEVKFFPITQFGAAQAWLAG